MGADIADQVTPVPMSPTLGQTLTRAAQYAQEQSHAEVALDHLLLSLTEDDDARQVMSSSGVDIAALQTDVSQQIGRIDARLPPGDEATAAISEELRRILNAAAVAARAGRRAMIDGAIVLAAIIGDAKTSAAGLLRAHGLTFEVAINVIRQASQSVPPPAAERGPVAEEIPATEEPAAPPPQTPDAPTGATNSILAAARDKIASRKVAGYSDQVAAKRALENETEQTDGANLDAIASAPAPAVEEPRATNTEATPPPEVDDTVAFDAPGPPTLAKPKTEEPKPSPPPVITPPAPPPIAAQPPTRDHQPPAAPAHHRPQPSQPPAPAPFQGNKTWAPSPSGAPPAPSGPPPRGAPPPIPAGVPSRPPAPVQTGHHPAAESYQSDRNRTNPPVTPNVSREPPWTGPPGGTPPGQPQPPASSPPLPSPAEVLPTNSRAPGEADRSAKPQRPRVRNDGQGRVMGRHEDSHTSNQSLTVLPGQLIENVPRRMRVGITSPVEVRIAKAEVKAISEGLGLNATHRHDIQVTKAMSVRLRAPEGGFFIETASPETQWIENALGLMADDYARWRWTVTPKLRGKRRLQLVVSARTVGPDGLAAETALPDQIIEIKVAANYSALAKRVAGWTVAAVIGGLLAQFGAQIWTVLEPLLRSLAQ